MSDGNLQTGDNTIIVHTANENISITVETVDINTDSTITLATDTHISNRIELEVASDGQTQYSNTSTTQLNPIDFQEDSITNDSTENSPFAFTTTQLSSLLDPKDITLLKNFGGIDGIVKGLHTDIHVGISNDEIAPLEPITLEEISGKELSDATKHTPSTTLTTPFAQRISAFGVNVLPTRKPKSIFALMWIAMQDKILVLLAIAAVVSLGLGLYEDFGVKRANSPDGIQQPKVSWVEGVAIIVAIFIVIMVGSVNDWQKEKQFQKLNAKKEDRDVKVIRDGKEQLLSVHKILVGDLLQLEHGDIIAVDGILVSGHNLKCDESAATGESDAIRKLKYEDCIDSDVKADPFIMSGSKVLEGVGTYIVTAVGINSYYGRIMMSLRSDPEDTPLQEKLNDLAERIAKLGGAAALLMFVVLLIKYFVAFKDGVPAATTVVESLTRIVISTVTVVVVAVPEGLPLAVTLALAFATTRMLKDNNLVRVLSACETMGNATTICSDKTGTLTQNKMTVVAGTISQSVSFIKDPVAHSQTLKNGPSTLSIKQLENPMAITDLTRTLPKNVTRVLEESIAINSTAFEGETNSDGKITFVGSKTETALLEFLMELGLKEYKKLREDAQIVQLFPFNSDRKAMGVVVKVSSTKWRFYVKGASEVLVSKSRYIIDIESNTENPSSLSPFAKDLTQESLDMLKNMITYYAGQSLRTIAMCYRDFEEWPPANMSTSDGGNVAFESLFNDITLIGIFGIEDPLREGVREAVLNCKKAGVYVRMVTGDNLLTAKSIATQCGIYTGGKIMEGPEFRNLPPAERDAIIPNLQVLARSSPDDKRILVSRLKELGEIVAVTGDGTNDGPALKTADVGFSMGIAGTEVAKEASAIILMDDNFSSIVKAIMWGRSVNDAVKKFLQFQLTVNVTAVLLTFISAVSSNEENAVLKAVQLLWVNLIMDTFAALALATDPPTLELLDRKPEPRTAPLISFDMWKMIIGQSIVQLAITLVLLYGGESLLHYGADQLQTLIFNTFVFLQIFNEINCRRLDNKLNIFKGILANHFFVFIFVVMVAGQVLIVNFGGDAFQVTRLNGEQWAISLGLGFISIPIGVIIRLIPNAPLRRLISGLKIPGKKAGTGTKRSDTFGLGKEEWNPAIANVRQKLFVFKTIRGGRLRASRLYIGHDKERAAKRSDAFAAATMVPSLVATSVGAGWSPNATNRSSRHNSNIQLDVGQTLAHIQRMSTSSSTVVENIEMQRKS